MEVEYLNEIKENFEKQNILTEKEINGLIHYFAEILLRIEKINTILNSLIRNESKCKDPIKLGQLLIKFDVELSVSIDYFKDARKEFNKVINRLYKKYSEE